MADHQRLYRRITGIDKAARALVLTDLTETAPPPDAHQAWLAAIEVAAERQLPLWSDDIAIRSIAVGKGLPAFGTWALLASLIEAGLIPDTRTIDALVLAEDGVIQFPRTARKQMLPGRRNA